MCAQRPFRMLMAVTEIMTVMVAWSRPIYSQPESMYVTIQDELRFSRIVEGDTIPASWFSPSYMYEMVYDSVCHVNFLFTECRRNDELLKLRSWHYNRLVHAPAAYMTYNSRTDDFPVRPGDTLEFFRELRWYNPITQVQD